ncbi:MAG: adenylosuccinate synthase [Planctomycetota bacterium]
MRHFCVVGLQWGDEGKGKIVDVLTRGVDAVVRYQGGANAGHTVCFDGEQHVIHHLPTGILRAGCLAILGNGMVIDPNKLLEEVGKLGADAKSRVFISERAHVVLPQHQQLDQSREEQAADRAAGKTKIGTTLRGIGPTYEAKIARTGVRIGDLLDPAFMAAASDDVATICRRFLDELGSQIVCTRALLERLHSEGKRFLFEGAQGTLLDVDHGTYPFVTSSNSTFLGLGPGSGFSPRRVDHVVGVTKAYCTRVGEGPFPSELHDETGEELRQRGGEFGSTTGRPRRCGWIDLVALKYAVELNDVDSIALTKSDVLNGRPKVPVVVGYKSQGKLLDTYPCRADVLSEVEPVVEEWPGWSEASRPAMEDFLARLEKFLGCPVSILSSGPGRSEVCVAEPFSSLEEIA